MKKDKDDKEVKEEKRNRRYFNLFHNKDSRYLKDLLFDKE